MSNKPWLAHYDDGVPHTLQLTPAPLTALLDAAAAQFPEAPAIVFYGRELRCGNPDKDPNQTRPGGRFPFANRPFPQ